VRLFASVMVFEL